MNDKDKNLLKKLHEPVADGFHGWYPDELHVAAARRIEELLGQLGTEQSMHRAWRKRAEEAESFTLSSETESA